jgi:hypothetical protein
MIMKKNFFVLFAIVLNMTLQAASPWDGTIATSFAGGTGTSADPYQISAPTQLAYLAQVVNANTLVTSATVYFILTSDLDLNNQPWTPIGSSDTYSFKGRFNGNNHLISNLNVNLATTIGVGLFGYINNAFIYNLGIVGNSTVTGLGSAGGIVGRCYITSTVTGNSIKGCFSNATVTSGASGCSGGIVGIFRATGNRAYLIDNCYSTGNITGSNYVGGIVGKVELPALTISNSYSTGTMTATGTAPNNLTGGVATAVTGGAPTVSNCYYINGDAANANGATALTADVMITPDFVTALNLSGATSNWKADFTGSSSVNNGFPILSWRTITTDVKNTLLSSGSVSVIGKTVKIEAPVLIKDMELYNFSGQLIEAQHINYASNNVRFDVQHAGVYLLNVHTAEGQLSQKIIIN